MGEYYNGVDKEREKEQRLMDRVYEWWDSLDEQEQYDLMQDWYPNEFREDDDGDSFFGKMPNDKQLWIWRRETNPAPELTQEEIDDIIGDREYHERAERGEIE